MKGELFARFRRGRMAEHCPRTLRWCATQLAKPCDHGQKPAWVVELEHATEFRKKARAIEAKAKRSKKKS